jgi:hypothetical protein
VTMPRGREDRAPTRSGEGSEGFEGWSLLLDPFFALPFPTRGKRMTLKTL